MSIIANLDINIRASSKAVEKAALKAIGALNQFGTALAALSGLGGDVVDVAGKMLAVRVSTYLAEAAVKRLSKGFLQFSKVGLNAVGFLVRGFKKVDDAAKTETVKKLKDDTKKLANAGTDAAASTKKLKSSLADVGKKATKNISELRKGITRVGGEAAAGVGGLKKALTGAGNQATTASGAIKGGLVPAIGAAGIAVKAFGAALTIATGGLNLLLGAIAGIGAAGAAAFGGLLIGSREGSRGIEELAKSARDIGVTSESLAGLHHAADLARVDVGSLDETLVSMQVRLRAAQTATSETSKGLSELGIAAGSLESKSPDEKFLAIADALSQVSDQTERARLATVTLGDEGAKLLPLFSRGASGIRTAMEEAKQLGLTVSEDQVKVVQQADDAMSSLKKSFTGLMRTAAIALAPLIKMFADGFTGAMKWVLSFRDRLLRFSLSVKFLWDHLGETMTRLFDTILHKSAYFAIHTGVQLKKKIEEIARSEKGQFARGFIHGLLPGSQFAEAAALEKYRELSARLELADAILRQQLEGDEAVFAEFNRRKQAFVGEHMKALASNKAAPGINPKLVDGPTARRDNAVVERGSQEAFALIARTSGNKMLKTANARLAAMREENRLLAQWAGVIH